MIYQTGKYVGVLVTLDVLCFMMIIFLAVSASKAYRFMANKDRILLFHFIFLEFSLFCNQFALSILSGKTLSLLLGALYYQNAAQTASWVEFYIFIENLGFVAFYLACSLNLYKWILLSARIDLYVNKHSIEQFNEKRKIQFWIYMSVMVIITVIELVLIAIDSSISDDQEAIVVDRFLNMVYSLNGIALGITFVIVGFKLLNKLNHHYEDIYEDKKTTIKFGIMIVTLSLLMVSVRFIYQELFAEYFSQMKVDALINNTWDFPAYEFCAVFFFELTPVMAQIVLIWAAAKNSWDDLEGPNVQSRFPSGDRINKTHSASVLQKSQAMMTEEGDSIFSSNEETLLKPYEQPGLVPPVLMQRDAYMSTDFAFNQQQLFFVNNSNKERQLKIRRELHSQSDEYSFGQGSGVSSGIKQYRGSDGSSLPN